MALVAFQLLIKVKADRLDDFLAVALDDARQTQLEPGSLRFEMWQQPDDPTRLVAFEIYRDEAALDAHRSTPYVDAWRAAVKEMTEEYTRMPLAPVFPTQSDWAAKPK